MKKLEYWDKTDTLFQKVWVDGKIESTLSQEKSKWPEDLVKKVEKSGYYVEYEDENKPSPSTEISKEELDKVMNNNSKEELPKLDSSSINAIVDLTRDDEIDNFTKKHVKESRAKKATDMTGIEQAKKPDDFLTAVEKPTHYQGILISGKNGKMEFEAIEIIDSIISMLNFNPSASHAIGDALKYILRCGKKDSDNNTTTDLNNKAKQDLLKSAWYIKWASNCL